MTSKVNKTQIGGNHYKSETGGEEHWDRAGTIRGPIKENSL